MSLVAQMGDMCRHCDVGLQAAGQVASLLRHGMYGSDLIVRGPVVKS